ncbi:cupin domain-containing protein [Paenibacillus urinalis]|uniref:Cupin domain-containing protein n=1 Tax=Paenibacillus urinalis TaxID=521520 RepID=A0AAX3N354_9BACL|nr:cupin domain-containing protein [Paenibacillus urinalis]WDH84288.1 cupin domain-containing protein [Paenibacillus urinalis]
MAVSYMDFTSPDVQFFDDVNKNRFFTKDSGNYINVLGRTQLNTLGNASLLDITLTRGNVVEPHVHQNASELVYVVSGEAIVSFVNPFTKEVLNFTAGPGQSVLVPQGWIHWEVASQDNTKIIAIFDAPEPLFIGISDFLRLAPTNTIAHTYCLDEAMLKQTLAPIKDTTVIGPPADCNKYHQPQTGVQGTSYNNHMMAPQGYQGHMIQSAQSMQGAHGHQGQMKKEGYSRQVIGNGQRHNY